MPDVNPHPPPRYHRLSRYLRERFGQAVRKVSLDAGLGCPNRDGTLGVDGCVFCDPAAFSPCLRQPAESIRGQLERGLAAAARRGVERVIAYFQPGSNTYASVERLTSILDEVIDQPRVVAVAVGTRPDCAADDVLDLLAELNGRLPVTVEYGIQTVHDASLAWIGRGHDAASSADAVARARRRGLRVVGHVILGLPGEAVAEMVETARALGEWGVDGVKLHQLYAVHGTRLAAMVAAGEVALPTLAEYAAWAAAFLEALPSTTVIERLVGDCPREYLAGPAWSLDKAAAVRAIEQELVRRDTWQGKAWPGPQPALGDVRRGGSVVP